MGSNVAWGRTSGQARQARQLGRSPRQAPKPWHFPESSADPQNWRCESLGFQELFWLEDIFYVSVVVMCMCIYIYMSMICVYSVVSYSYIHIYHPFPTKIAIQFTKFELFSEIDHPQVLSHIFKANYRQVGHIFVCFVCENFLPLLLKTIFGSPQKNGSKQKKQLPTSIKRKKKSWK